MKKQKSLWLILISILTVFTLLGCSTSGNESSGEFAESDGLDDNGFWEGITALDHVELCEYEGILIPSDTHNITDEAVQTEIDSIMDGYTVEEQVTDRSVVDGDTVNIDYVGTIDGVEFDGGSTEGAGTDVTIGVTSYIDDFLEQLIGHSPGESFDIEVTFPEDYGNEELNGKDAIFAITINHIVETVPADLTDDFVQTNLSADYGWNTVTEIEEGIKSDLQESAIWSYIEDYILENTQIDSLPDKLLEYQKNAVISYYQDYAEYYSMELEDFLSSYMGLSSTDELIEQNIDGITETANLYLILQAIAEDTGITISDADVAAYFEDNLGSADYSEYEEYYGMPYLKLVVLDQAVMDHLVDNAILE